tara:strand:+ start:3674 stop:4438 length:765 start_codon:yes stop_codon:yes gene_type:complete
MAEDQNSENVEIVPLDQTPEVIETDESQVQETQVEGSHEPEDKQERNWKEIRRKQRESEIRERAKDELIEKLLNAKQNPVSVEKKVEEPDEFAGIATDDYPTWGQTDKRIEKRAEAIAERKYKEMQEQDKSSRFLQRLESKYDDFQDVVNADSIALLEEKEPELAQTIADLKDPYKMGLQSYHYLKRAAFTDEISNKRHKKEVEKKIDKNEKTVQSPQAFSKRPMAQAYRLTSAEKSKLFEEMTNASRGASSGY